MTSICATPGCGAPSEGGVQPYYCSVCRGKVSQSQMQTENQLKPITHMDVRVVKENLVKLLRAAVPLGSSAVEAILDDPHIQKPEEIAGSIGETFEAAIQQEKLDVCRMLAKKYEDNSGKMGSESMI